MLIFHRISIPHHKGGLYENETCHPHTCCRYSLRLRKHHECSRGCTKGEISCCICLILFEHREPEDTNPQKDTASSGPDEATVTESSTDSDFGSEFAMFKKDQAIEETVLYELNDVKITATGLNYGDYNVELNVTLENHSDRDLTFLAGTMGYSCNAVNGWMIEDGWINEDVTAGGSVDTTVRFNTTELLFHGITEVADIQVGFEIEDADYNKIYTGPLTTTTPLAASYDYGNDIYRKAINSRALQLNYDYTIDAFAETEVYNEGGIRILVSTQSPVPVYPNTFMR